MILTRNEMTKIAILNALTDSNVPITKTALTRTLDISLSTLKRNVQQLNEDIQLIPEFQSIKILPKNSTYLLHNLSPFSPYYVIKKITLNYYKESIHFKFFLKIFSYSIKHISELSKSLSISQPYVYKLLAKTNQYIAPFEIKIEFSNNSDVIYISGNQKNIRLFQTYFFWNIYHGIEWPFSELSIDQLYSFFSEKELDVFFKISQNKQQKFLYSLVVANQIFPRKYGQLTLEDDFLETISIFKQTIDLSTPLERMLFYSYGPDISQKEIELERIFFNFSARVFCPCTDTEVVQIEIGKQLCQLDNPLIVYCKNFIRALFQKFPELEDNPNGSVIAYQMVYYLSLFFANTFYIHFDSSYLNEFMLIAPDIHGQKTKLFQEAKHFFTNFMETNPPLGSAAITDFHLELGYGLTYYFLVNLEVQPLSLYVQFSKNMFGETYIKAKLFQMFGKENIIFSDNIHTASFIISNYFEDRYKNKKYFYLDNLEDPEMWSRLYTQIHQLQMP